VFILQNQYFCYDVRVQIAVALRPLESSMNRIANRSVSKKSWGHYLITLGLVGYHLKGIRNQMRRILMVVAAMLIFGGCVPEGVEESRPSTPPPAGVEADIPHPILDDMEPLVATELADRRAELDRLLENEAEPEISKGKNLGRMGQLYQAHRLLDVAEACYREAQALEPENHAWPYYRGILAASRGDLDTAGAAFEVAVGLAPRDVPAKIRFADLELDRGNVETAMVLYEEARALDASLAAVEYGLGRSAAEHRDFEQAVQFFKKALALQPGASVIHYHLGQAFRQLGRADEARNHLSQSGQVRVAMPDPLMQELATLMIGASPYLTRGNAALREGRFEAGAEEYRLAVEADPENLRARQSLASVLLRLGDQQGAKENFEAAVRLDAENARAQSDLGVLLADMGDTERAIRHLRLAVELEPALEKAQFNLGNTLSKMGEHDQAVSTYRHLLEIDPSHLEARSRLGTALAQAGRVEEGIAELRQVAERDPGNARVRLNLGVALAETGDLRGAIVQHLAVIDLKPDRARLTLAQFNLGTFYKKTGDPQRAEEHYRKALEQDPKLAGAHFDLGEIMSAQGRLAEALPHYSRAADIQPNSAVVRLRAATTLMRLERYSDAVRALERGVRRIPGERRLEHALARLLAACPEGRLRDGRRSFSMAAEVFESERTPPHAETLAMALAEVGRFEDAVQLQRRILDEFEKSASKDVLERLRRNLDLYTRGATCCAAPSDVLP
jgi:tetratricopeptide (TPR) repeat protein